MAAGIDLERLLKLRLAVARFGEMDCGRWWNTQGILGPRGDAVVQRGFLRTHRFVQARIVFAVAKARCAEVFSAPHSVNLWSLPPELEDAFEDRWQHWLDDAETWSSFFDEIGAAPQASLPAFLVQLNAISQEQSDAAKTLSRSYEEKAVQLGPVDAVSDELLSKLAVGFSCSDPGRLAVPFAVLEAAE